MGDFGGVEKMMYRKCKPCIRSDINLSVPGSWWGRAWIWREQAVESMHFGRIGGICSLSSAGVRLQFAGYRWSILPAAWLFYAAFLPFRYSDRKSPKCCQFIGHCSGISPGTYASTQKKTFAIFPGGSQMQQKAPFTSGNLHYRIQPATDL